MDSSDDFQGTSFESARTAHGEFTVGGLHEEQSFTMEEATALFESSRISLETVFENEANLVAVAQVFRALQAKARAGVLAGTGICQDTSKKLVRSLFIPEEPQQGLCPYASLPQDIFLT